MAQHQVVDISQEIAHACGSGDGQHGTDFVTDYAGRDPAEDFAETAAFLANFEITKHDLGTNFAGSGSQTARCR